MGKYTPLTESFNFIESSEHKDAKWICRKRAKNREYDELVKTYDELVRSIREGKLDFDNLTKSAAEGNIDAKSNLHTMLEFLFTPIEPPWWERLFLFLFRR